MGLPKIGKKPPKPNKDGGNQPNGSPGARAPSPANTPSHYFMDTPASKKACEKELKLVHKNCTPEAPGGKKSGMVAKLGELTDVVDAPGKTAAGYIRDSSKGALDGNAWMDDNCTGQWTTPLNDKEKFPDEELKKQFEELTDNLDLGMIDKASMLKKGVEELASLAKEYATPQVVEGILTDLATKTGIKVVIGGLGGPETAGIITVLMAIWTAYDMYQTAQTLAALAGDKGKAAMEAFKSIYDIGDEVEKIVDEIKDNPAKAYTNAMALTAKLNPCLRARKCLLVKYSNTTGSPTKAMAQAKHGKGCCPGQTGHHILPDSMVKGAGCAGYDGKDAPVMCMEGTSNSGEWGSHGNAHARLKKSLFDYRKDSQTPNAISYNDAADQGIDAVRDAAAIQCDKACLRAQLDEYYQCDGKTLKPADGTGPFHERPEPDGGHRDF